MTTTESALLSTYSEPSVHMRSVRTSRVMILPRFSTRRERSFCSVLLNSTGLPKTRKVRCTKSNEKLSIVIMELAVWELQMGCFLSCVLTLARRTAREKGFVI